MNCDRIRHQLLAAPCSERPPAEVESHLGQCPPCRQWQQRLAGMEEKIRQLPVPPSEGKRRLLRELLGGQGGEWESPQLGRVACSHTQDLAASHSSRFPLYRVLTLAAAGLLLAVCGWWLLRDSTPPPTGPIAARPLPPPDPLLEALSEGHLRLLRLGTLDERIEELGHWVDHLHARAQTLAPLGDSATLESLAALFDRLVSDGLVRGTRALDREQRQRVIPLLSERLARVGEEADQWTHAAPPAAAAPLRQIALAVRTGSDQLRTLLDEGSP